MSGPIETKLAELNITLPEAPSPAANYVPFVQSGNLVFVSGQISRNDEGLTKGKLGKNLETEAGYAAARECALGLIAQLKAACGGDLEKLVRVVKLGGFVNCTPGFTEQPQVINGASDLMVEVFGAEKGSHARAAVGVPALPFGVAVEIEGIFEIA